MSKFDELKKEAEVAIEQKWFNRLREEDAKAILELLAIQAQLVAALEALEEVGALEDGLLGDDPKIIKAQKLARDALALGAQP